MTQRRLKLPSYVWTGLLVLLIGALLLPPARGAFAADSLGVTKTGPATAAAGSTAVYTITVSNPDPNGRTDPTGTLHLLDSFPAGTTFVSGSQTSGPTWNCGASDVTKLDCTLASMLPGESASFTLSLQMPGSGGVTVTNSVDVTDSAGPTANAQVQTQVLDTPALQVSKTGPSAAGPNGFIIYAIGVSNSFATATGVSLSDAIPAGLTFVSLVQNSGAIVGCTTPAVGSNGSVTCPLGDMAPADSFSFALTVHVPVATAVNTVFNNTATATATNAPSADSPTVQTTIGQGINLNMEKHDSPHSLMAGQNLTYTLLVNNESNFDAANVVVNDPLPSSLQFLSVSAPAPFACSTPAVGSNGTVNCVGAIVPAGSYFLTIITKVSPSTPAGMIHNVATVTSNTFDLTPNDNQPSTDTTVASQADLVLTKTDTPDPVLAGGNITYTIALQNNGPSDATSVRINESVPLGTSLVSFVSPGGWSCPSVPAIGATTGAFSCDAARLPAMSTATFTFVVQVNGAAPDGSLISNTVSASTATPVLSPANLTPAPTTTAVINHTDLVLTKTGAPNPVNTGGSITYTLTLANNGPLDAQNVVLTDAVPANSSFVSLSQGATGPAFVCTTPAVGGSGNVTCSLATMTAGASRTFTLVVKANDGLVNGTVITNTAIAATTTLDPDGATATATTTISSGADLALTKTDAPDPVVAGNNLTYSLTLTNGGPNPAQAVTVTEPLPAGAVFVSATQPAGWTAAAPAVGAGGSVVFSAASLASGASAAFTIVVKADGSSATLANTAIASSTTSDPDPTNDTATATTAVTPSADLAITKSQAVGSLTYTINVINNGPSAAGNVVVSDILPAGTAAASASQTSGPAFTVAAPPAGPVTFSIVSLANGASASFSLVLSPTGGPKAFDARPVSNTVTVASSTPDPIPANNSATAGPIVPPSADLSVGATVTAVGSATPNGPKGSSGFAGVPAGNIVYSLTLNNLGQTGAAGVALSDVLPANTTFVAATQTGGPAFSIAAPAVGSSGTVVFTAPSLASGVTASFSLTVHVNAGTPPGTSIADTVTVSSATPDPASGNNTATATVAAP